MIGLWIKRILVRRPGRLLGAAAGIAGATAMVVALGAFLASSTATMMQRALEHVPIDWQVQLVPGADVAVIEKAVRAAAPIAHLEGVAYADVAAFEAHTGGSVQTTGSAKVIGVGLGYWTSFPGQVRRLIGAESGVLLSQQTAANLHATTGDLFIVRRIGFPEVELKIAGIIDLPNADAIFQGVGLTPGAAPQAPPDNLAVVPIDDWHRLFDPQRSLRPDTTRFQLHAVTVRGHWPAAPDAAYPAVVAAGHNLEARVVGQALLANNLATRLDAVRSDALYAKMLFLFLGAPGLAVAMLLTLAIGASGRNQRQRDHALLRIRGASTNRILSLCGCEAAIVAAVGLAVGTVLAWIATKTMLHGALFTDGTISWFAGAAAVGALMAVAAVLLPAWTEIASVSITEQRAALGPERVPIWRRIYLDVGVLVVAGALFWQAAGTGYQVVLAPEGVAATAVQYQAFLAPLLLLLGFGLLTLRIADWGLAAGRTLLAAVLRPLAGPLARVVAASLSRQRRRLTVGIGLTTLAFAFATSTAIFNETFHTQALIDAQLTNGADVSVSGPPFTSLNAQLAEISRLPGVSAAETMQHRLAYVGNDLQDIYGIDPRRIGRATTLSNAFFGNGNAAVTLALLAATEDGVLVSEETVKDYRLSPGDTIKLRLQSANDHQYRVVPFKFIGIVREFPTAPRDSFLVANAGYIAKATGSDATEVVLVRTRTPATVADAVRPLVRSLPGVKVGEIGAVGKIIGSSLTAINVAGLTRLELTFALVASIAATGLLLSLGLADRRRTFALLTVLRATRRQLASFVLAEALVILLTGIMLGSAAGTLTAKMLVTMLTGVFDPPPEGIVIPGSYLILLFAAAAISTFAAAALAIRRSHEHALEQMRTLQ